MERSIMIVDVHTHIFPPEVIRERELYFAREPEFQLLYGSPRAKLASAEDIIESMDRNGIDYSVVFGFPWKTREFMVRHNDYVIESAAKNPGRLIPLACLDLFSGSCIQSAEQYLHDGVAGFGELAIYGATGDLALATANFSRVADMCRKSGSVLLVHANEPVGHVYPGKSPFGIEFYYSLAKAAAGAHLIFAHWGGGLLFYELLKKEAPGVLTDVHYDTAASPFLYRAEIYKAATDIVGSAKILFGSDYPLISPDRYFEEMKQSGLSGPQLDAIKGKNAARIFGLEP
jgi:uncharacterized protein